MVWKGPNLKAEIWKGPFVITRKIGDMLFEITGSSKIKSKNCLSRQAKKLSVFKNTLMGCRPAETASNKE